MDDSRIGAWLILGLFVLVILWHFIDEAIGYYKACKKVKIGGLYRFQSYFIGGYLMRDDLVFVRVKGLKEYGNGHYWVVYQGEFIPDEGKAELDYFVEHYELIEQEKEEQP